MKDVLSRETATAQRVPAEQVPAEQVPAEQVPAEQVPAEQVPAEQVPAEQRLVPQIDLPRQVVPHRSPEATAPALPAGHRPVRNRPATAAFLGGFAVVLAVGLAVLLTRTDGGSRLVARLLRLQSPPESAQPAQPGTNTPPRVFALGRLEPLGEVASLAAPEGAGTAAIKELRVTEGAAIQAGQVLAVLDNETRLLAERDSAERRLEQARAKLDQARIVTAATRAELEASLRSAEISLDIARIQWDRRQRLFQSRANSQDDLDQARRDRELAEQQVAVVQAQLRRYDSVAGKGPVDVLVAQQEVAVAEAQVAEAAARLKQAYVVAPCDGTLLDVRVRPGEPVSQGPLFDIGATETMMVRIEVYESDVQRLRAGQTVQLKSPALAETLTGRVEWIATLVKRQSIVQADPAANTDARVVEVLAEVDNTASQQARRFVGLQVQAEFVP